MKVKDLIRMLEGMPQDANVKFQFNDSDLLYGFVNYIENDIRFVMFNTKTQQVDLQE